MGAIEEDHRRNILILRYGAITKNREHTEIRYGSYRKEKRKHPVMGVYLYRTLTM
jgi:hypothetical protein